MKGGPGRAGNGNFDLTDFRVVAAPEHPAAAGRDRPAPPTAVRLVNPRATFEQPGLPIKATIDADPRSGWAVNPQFGRDQAAVYETESPVGFAGGTRLTFTLVFNGNYRHNIGRLRLALSTAATPVAIRSAGMPARIAAILRGPPRSATRSKRRHCSIGIARSTRNGSGSIAG